MFRSKRYLAAIVALLWLVSLSCTIDLGTGEEGVPLETAVAQTLAALNSGGVTQQQAIVPTQELLATVTPAPAATATMTPTITLTPQPCNRPKFISETVADGSTYSPGSAFTKSWTIRNDGTCTWNTNYKLVYTSGDQMGGAASQNLTSSVAPGGSITLSVNLTAPAAPGTYKGFWALQADNGERNGNYWVQIVVPAPPAELFAVTSVTLGGDQLKVGFCPLTFNLKADITVSAPGKVKYHWVFTNGFESPVETLNFSAAGTKSVTYSKSFGCGSSVCTYGAQIYIDDPNHQSFGSWVMAINCI